MCSYSSEPEPLKMFIKPEGEAFEMRLKRKKNVDIWIGEMNVEPSKRAQYRDDLSLN